MTAMTPEVRGAALYKFQLHRQNKREMRFSNSFVFLIQERLCEYEADPPVSLCFCHAAGAVWNFPRKK